MRQQKKDWNLNDLRKCEIIIIIQRWADHVRIDIFISTEFKRVLITFVSVTVCGLSDVDVCVVLYSVLQCSVLSDNAVFRTLHDSVYTRRWILRNCSFVAIHVVANRVIVSQAMCNVVVRIIKAFALCLFLCHTITHEYTYTNTDFDVHAIDLICTCVIVDTLYALACIVQATHIYTHI